MNGRPRGTCFWSLADGKVLRNRLHYFELRIVSRDATVRQDQRVFKTDPNVDALWRSLTPEPDGHTGNRSADCGDRGVTRARV